MRHEDYTIGWVCALPLEAAAAYGMLDEKHEPLPSRFNDGNNYTFGRIGQHNVVIACLPYGVMGTISAARVAERLLLTFSELRFALMVGIGGGVPSDEHDIRLGDIVVSKPEGKSGGVIQYDYGKTIQGGRFVRTGSLNRPPDVLLTALATLEARSLMEGHHLARHFVEMFRKFPMMTAQFPSPGPDRDVLYRLQYDHPKGQPTCARCTPRERVDRTPRSTEDAVVHYGLIASGDQVMKHGRTRDRLRRELDVLCFEMEASGLMDAFPCLVIRGICDYSDSHKNSSWQPFAAAVASAYAKELLAVIQPTNVADARLATQVTESNPPADRASKISPGPTPQENIPPVPRDSAPTPQAAAGATVAAKYALASVPYTLAEVQLGSLVQDKRRANQDSTGPPHTLRHGTDYTWRNQTNFHYLQHLPQHPTVAARLKQLFAPAARRSSAAPATDLWAREGRVYELMQPRALFQRLCAAKQVRDWLLDAYDDGYSPHLVVGYRTLVDATTASSAEQGASTDASAFQLPGERIFAVAFRRVRFRWSKPDKADEAYLAKETVWMAPPVRRGAGETQAVVEVELGADGGAAEQVLVANGPVLEGYYIADEENDEDEGDDNDGVDFK